MALNGNRLLGGAALLVTAGAAQAADLPARKATPIEYVRVCSAYGPGFWLLPGTDTCMRIGGYARFDFQYTPGHNIINPANGTISQVAANQDTSGMEVRGALTIDGRTQTPWGTAQTFFRFRNTATDGIRATSSVTNFQTSYAPQAAKTSATIERAYIRFGGFTFGVIDDDFSPLPSIWILGNFTPGFTNGVKGISYTATTAAGLSASVALQSRGDFAYDGNTSNLVAPSVVPTANNSTYVTTPTEGMNLVGTLRYDQTWGFAQVAGAIGQNSTSTAPLAGNTNNLLLGSKDYAAWGVGAAAAIKLPMLASGDTLYLMATYGHGMLGEVTGTYISSLTSDSSNKRATGGVLRADSNLVVTRVSAAGAPLSYGTEDGYMFYGALTHFWSPDWRSNFGAQYVRYLPPTAFANGAGAGLNTQNGNASAWQVAANLIWSPTRQLDIAFELAYGEVRSSIQNAPAAFLAAGSPGLYNTTWLSKMRVQRTF